ncbi:hypothetical protein B296_00053340 [Ensete ventricosum]|uniref:Uncharacterized protein n=1 Tax=Ensete ventricosum TaxID=4639 RepID=A0A426WYH2_ENSVE|nr:hypothetical protein B296_00053340 [Ensete ventricosum]
MSVWWNIEWLSNSVGTTTIEMPPPPPPPPSYTTHHYRGRRGIHVRALERTRRVVAKRGRNYSHGNGVLFRGLDSHGRPTKRNGHQFGVRDTGEGTALLFRSRPPFIPLITGAPSLHVGGADLTCVRSAVRPLEPTVYPTGYLRRVDHVDGPAVHGRDDLAVRLAFVISFFPPREDLLKEPDEGVEDEVLCLTAGSRSP